MGYGFCSTFDMSIFFQKSGVIVLNIMLKTIRAKKKPEKIKD